MTNGLVLLTSHFEATGEIFWGGTRQETRTISELGNPLQTSAPRQGQGVWTPTCGLAYRWPNARRTCSGFGFRAWNPPASQPRSYHWATAAQY
ncbi:hypothetical protein AVEN_144526-1 [Araneus ventricosus]|uniref:Uncharacterized protein n=1 Tax=Araneus ventricosus TaxID=182803 RepID=A0A4Y2GE97_ARAVE|nr:hypothetical protein AVEN_144526-1 [Araneus ventricosus]